MESEISMSHHLNDEELRLVTRDTRVTRSGEAYAQLRHGITTLQLPPGHAFTEADVCEWLAMSKAPVRGALAQLRREGLVNSAARSGYTVAPITVQDARDLFALRTLLEGETATLAAARGGDVDRLREIDDLCRTQYDPSDTESVHAFLRANTKFHVAVAELAGNRRIVVQLVRVIDHLQRYMHLGLTQRSRSEAIVHEHRDLLGAIAAGDARLARQLADRHTRDSHRMVLDGLLASDALVTANIGADLARLG